MSCNEPLKPLEASKHQRSTSTTYPSHEKGEVQRQVPSQSRGWLQRRRAELSPGELTSNTPLPSAAVLEVSPILPTSATHRDLDRRTWPADMRDYGQRPADVIGCFRLRPGRSRSLGKPSKRVPSHVHLVTMTTLISPLGSEIQLRDENPGAKAVPTSPALRCEVEVSPTRHAISCQTCLTKQGQYIEPYDASSRASDALRNRAERPESASADRRKSIPNATHQSSNTGLSCTERRQQGQ